MASGGVGTGGDVVQGNGHCAVLRGGRCGRGGVSPDGLTTAPRHAPVVTPAAAALDRADCRRRARRNRVYQGGSRRILVGTRAVWGRRCISSSPRVRRDAEGRC